MLQFELTDEAKPVAEAVIEQEDEPMEIELSVLVLWLVEVKIHIAGNRPRPRDRGALLARSRRPQGGHRLLGSGRVDGCRGRCEWQLRRRSFEFTEA